ncbi:MAG: glycyl-radical enzyme activating protein [Desulfobacteraceae bacterium]|nr:MAG: glycyl-radical enzyme activating protein [Desulfobacteraceae bacterium]
MKHTPLILDIKGNSLDDGPGIRSVVFFKGCPLSCVWCHNPESKKPGPEISFDQAECVGCDSCLGVCPEHALNRNLPFFIDRNCCTLCGACVENCPSGALSMVGKSMSVGDIVTNVSRDKPFYKNSGGGVTCSGGEPTLYMDFLSSLLQRLKTNGIHTLLETCGMFDFTAFSEKIVPYTDAVYYDIKIHDPDTHQQFCGVKNDLILKNFIKLNAIALQNGFELLPRTPLIPNITATEKNLTAIAGFLNTQSIRKARLLAYNPLWHDKTGKIGTTDSLRTQPEMTSWISRDKLEKYAAIFSDHGIDT